MRCSARTSGKRKRKKHRSQTRKFEAAGGFRRIEAQHAETRSNALLDAFFAMKEVRFQKMGIANVFGDAEVQTLLPRAVRRCADSRSRRLSCSHGARGRRQAARRHRIEPVAASA